LSDVTEKQELKMIIMNICISKAFLLWYCEFDKYIGL